MKRRIGLALVLVPAVGWLVYAAVSIGWPDGLYLAGVYAGLLSVGIGIVLVSER